MKDRILKIYNHPVFKLGIIYTITDAINKCIPFVLLPVLTYYLLPADFGIISNFNVIISVAAILVGLNADGAIAVNYFKLSKSELASYISNTMLLILGAFLICLLAIIVFHNQIYNVIKLPYEYQIASLFLVLGQSVTAINLELWRLEEKPLKFGIYQISQTAVNLLLSLYFIVILKTGWHGRVNAILIVSVLYGVISLFILFKRGYLKISIRKDYYMDVLHFSIPLIPHSLSIWIRSGIDRIFITSIVGAAATGIYATGFQFGILVSFLVMAFNNAFVPYLFKQLSTEDEVLLQAMKVKLVKMTYLLMGLLVVLCIVLTIFSTFLVNHVLSKNYLSSENYVFWAILAQTFQGMYLLFVNYIFFAKKTKFLAMITFFCSLLQVILSYSLIKYIGPLGAAYSSVVISLINFIAVWIYSARVYPMPWFNFKSLK